RRHNQREPEGGLAVLDLKWTGEDKFDDSFFAGSEVAHPDGEHVGTLLFHDGRPLAGGQGLFVGDPGLTALLEDPDDPATGQDGYEIGDAGAWWEREHVGGFNRVGAVVDKALPDRRCGRQADDLSV